MARLQESGSPIDLITLAESLERQGQLDSVGGFAYLAELSKIRQVRLTSVPMRTSCVNVPLSVR